MKTEEYLQIHFIDIEKLAEKTGVSSGQIMEMVNARCIPHASYRRKGNQTITNEIYGDCGVAHAKDFFHPDVELLIRAVCERQSQGENLQEIARENEEYFFAELKSSIESFEGKKWGFVDCFDSVGCWINSIFEEIAIEKYHYYCEGVYGICLTKPSAHAIARKQILIAQIDVLSEKGFDRRNAEFAEAVRELDALLSFFAPYERALSSRAKYIKEAME